MKTQIETCLNKFNLRVPICYLFGFILIMKIFNIYETKFCKVRKKQHSIQFTWKMNLNNTIKTTYDICVWPLIAFCYCNFFQKECLDHENLNIQANREFFKFLKEKLRKNVFQF